MTEVSPEFRTQVEEAIHNEIAPYVASHHGKIALKHIYNGVVFVEMTGACENCASANVTLRSGVERMLRKKFREIKAVKLWTDSPDDLL